MRYLSTLIFVSLLSTGVLAQISFTGQYIPRAEYRHGYGALAASSQDVAFSVTQRARLNFGYTHAKYLFGVAVQDIRTWGSEPQLNISDNLLSIHEAWGEWLFTKNFSLKLGRQELVYDDHRILGNVDWAMQGRSHDVALLKYRGEKLKLHVGLGFNQDKQQTNTNLYTVTNNYKTIQYIWINTDVTDSANISFLFLNNGVQMLPDDSLNNNISTKFSQTIGTRAVVTRRFWTLSGAVYFQTGKVGIQDLSAFYLGLDCTYTGIKKLDLTPGFEWLSGTSQIPGNGSKNHSFNPLYGTNHKFNGFMDYFYVGNHINNVGLKDFFLKMGYRMNRNAILLQTHWFLSDKDILDSDEYISNGTVATMDHYLGTEVDLTWILKYSSNISLSIGYSQMFGTNSMEELKGGDSGATSNWAYIMLQLKPDFLAKKEP